MRCDSMPMKSIPTSLAWLIDLEKEPLKCRARCCCSLKRGAARRLLSTEGPRPILPLSSPCKPPCTPESLPCCPRNLQCKLLMQPCPLIEDSCGDRVHPAVTGSGGGGNKVICLKHATQKRLAAKPPPERAGQPSAGPAELWLRMIS